MDQAQESSKPQQENRALSFWAVGRRKTAVARVKICAGDGTIKINQKSMDKYFFGCDALQYKVIQPLKLIEGTGKFNVLVNVHGGGKTGQAGAIQHGLARAIARMDEGTKSLLRKNGFLTRDPRMVERKKAGRPKARKRFQFSKR